MGPDAAAVSDGPRRDVWVLRHAKAVPHTSDDHGRRLTPRGHRQCAELAAHLVDRGAVTDVPTTVLVSSAARALETAELVLGGIGSSAAVDVRPELYRADADDVIEMLRELDDDAASVMVVGHNPTLEHLVWLLLDPEDDFGRRAAEEGLSTCALAVLSTDAPRWSVLTPGSGRMHLHYAPKAR